MNLKKLIPSLLIILAPFTLVIGSSEKIDSIKKVVNTTSTDTTKIKALNNLGWKLMYNNLDSAISLSESALNIAIEINNKKHIANTHYNLGTYFIIKSDYPKALNHNLKALELNKKIDNKTNIASCYNNLGVIYKKQSNYPNALEYYFKALEIYKKLEFNIGKASSYNNIGLIYENQSNYPKALEFYFKALEIFKKKVTKEV